MNQNKHKNTKASVLPNVGQIYPENTLFLRNHVGEAKSGKLKYEMATCMNGAPLIQSKQTGKWFSLSWKDILTLAEKAGINLPTIK